MVDPLSRKKKYFELTEKDLRETRNEYQRRNAFYISERGYRTVSAARPDGSDIHQRGWIKSQFSYVRDMMENAKLNREAKVEDLKTKLGNGIYLSFLKAIFLTNRDYEWI